MNQMELDLAVLTSDQKIIENIANLLSTRRDCKRACLIARQVLMTDRLKTEGRFNNVQ